MNIGRYLRGEDRHVGAITTRGTTEDAVVVVGVHGFKVKLGDSVIASFIGPKAQEHAFLFKAAIAKVKTWRASVPEDVAQCIFALERCVARLNAEADALHEQRDYDAQFPASDAESVRKVIEMLKGPTEPARAAAPAGAEEISIERELTQKAIDATKAFLGGGCAGEPPRMEIALLWQVVQAVLDNRSQPARAAEVPPVTGMLESRAGTLSFHPWREFPDGEYLMVRLADVPTAAPQPASAVQVEPSEREKLDAAIYEWMEEACDSYVNTHTRSPSMEQEGRALMARLHALAASAPPQVEVQAGEPSGSKLNPSLLMRQCGLHENSASLASAALGPARAAQPVALNIIRKWPEGFEDRLEHVWLDVVGFIPNFKLYDLQRVLAEFGFRMDVYEDATPPQPQPTLCACGDRAADSCPGEWEPGCDLGANEKHARIYVPSADEAAALAELSRSCRTCRYVLGGDIGPGGTLLTTEKCKRWRAGKSLVSTWNATHSKTKCGPSLQHWEPIAAPSAEEGQKD